MADNNQKPDVPRNALIIARKKTILRIITQSPKKNLRIRRLSKISKELDKTITE